ncbi:MAG TPA: helix-turn-helix domain-containing protein [Polyangiales bacterium]|nr:helix-turn-helix domain-containing protein [Polyangiales bacterium]
MTEPRVLHQYRELPPAPALRPFIECYWRATSHGQPAFRPTELLVPDLRIEVIFNPGEPWRWNAQETSALTCIGMRGHALSIQQPGRLDHFAVRFRPGGLAAFSGIPLAELTGRCWEMRCIWPNADELAERLYDARTDDERMRLMDACLLRMLAPARDDQQRALHAARTLSQSHGMTSIAELAESYGLHYKRLERLFARHVGLSPKHFARVARLQHVLDLSTTRPRRALSELAAEGGYSDQAHFNRDFRALIGRSPGQFFAERFAVFETMARSGSLDLKPV